MPTEPRLPKFPQDPDTLLVNEFFTSLQGESTHAGRPCFFIRLAGCHLRCTYCDTAYAFHEGTPYRLGDILARTKESGCRLVEVTGGEPLLQKPVYALFEQLLAQGYEVLLETSGSLDAERVPVGVKRIFDLKTPGSGEAEANCAANFKPESLRPGDEFKFVIASRADYEWARAQARTTLAHAIDRVLFSPVWDRVRPDELAQWILEDKLPVRFQLQLHKVIWGEKRGT